VGVRQGRRRNGGTRHGLWEHTPSGIAAGEVRDNPRVRACPSCQAAPMHGCRRLSRRGWITMVGYHYSREKRTADGHGG
jgi:hypothetical protein